ncbi:MAG: hypothetical protein GY861_15585 [bacterium]|nr:hypothetical protein [bacterium]
MWLYEVKFETDKSNNESKQTEIIHHTEYIVAETFKDVYEKVVQQDNEVFELVFIKKLVPIISIIKST